MLEFAISFSAFLISHSLPARPSVRMKLVQVLGYRPYLMAYSLLSIALLVWLLSAASRAPYIELWPADPRLYFAPVVLMALAFFLLVAGCLCPNPLSVSFAKGRFEPHRPAIVGITRHPILWAFALWALSHVIPNGDLVSLMMFGGFGLFALLAMPIIDRRKQRELGQGWVRLARHTSILPFAALGIRGASLRWRKGLLAATVLGAVSAYASLMWLHPLLFGPDPKIIFAYF